MILIIILKNFFDRSAPYYSLNCNYFKIQSYIISLYLQATTFEAQAFTPKPLEPQLILVATVHDAQHDRLIPINKEVQLKLN